MNFNKTQLAENVRAEFDLAVDKSAEVAEAMLMEQGWDILKELHQATYASVIATSIVMIPVMQHKETILSKVSDPTAFSNNLATASKEIAELVKSVQTLQQGHIDKTGSPDLEDMELVSDLTLGYSQVQTCMESAVQPLLLAMIEHMQEAGIDTEAVFLGEETVDVTE